MDKVVKGKLGEIKKEVPVPKTNAKNKRKKNNDDEEADPPVREKYMKVDKTIANAIDKKMENNAKKYAEDKVEEKKKNERPKRNRK